MNTVLARQLAPGLEVTPTDLRIAGSGLSFEQYEETLGDLLGMGDSVRWWVGDLLLYARGQFGERYAQALEATRLTEHQLNKYRWVAEKVAPSLRRRNLSFSHHELVAALEPPDQSRLLALADASNHTVEQFRTAIRDHKAFEEATETRSRQTVMAEPSEVDAARGVRTVRNTLVRLGGAISPEARESSGINESMSALNDVTKTVKRASALEPLSLAVAAVIAAGVRQTGLPDPAVIVPSGPWDTLVAAYATATDGGA